MPDSSANALQELVKAANIDESGCRVSEHRAKKNVGGLVLAARVLNQVRWHRRLASALLLIWMPPLDQAGDDGADPERALRAGDWRGRCAGRAGLCALARPH